MTLNEYNKLKAKVFQAFKDAELEAEEDEEVKAILAAIKNRDAVELARLIGPRPEKKGEQEDEMENI
ncbi:MAG TPA: hypothetical protein VL854_11880 [Nitrososphaeraceae archaeon]|nr:hypothetical protein [Nitrososphaeraceae archaeon]